MLLVSITREPQGGAVGKVDQAIALERPAVIDFDNHFLAVVEVGHLGVGGQGQGLVRRRGQVHVVGLAARSAAAMELAAIP